MPCKKKDWLLLEKKYIWLFQKHFRHLFSTLRYFRRIWEKLHFNELIHHTLFNEISVYYPWITYVITTVSLGLWCVDNKQQQWSEASSGEEARCFHSHLCRRGSQQTLPTLIKYRINTPCHAQSALLIGQTYMHPLPRTASSVTLHITQLRSHVPNQL